MSPSDVSDFVVPDEKFTFWNLSTLHRRYLRSHITAVQKSKAMTATTTMATKHSPSHLYSPNIRITIVFIAIATICRSDAIVSTTFDNIVVVDVGIVESEPYNFSTMSEI